jgi:hypothetical protein
MTNHFSKQAIWILCACTELLAQSTRAPRLLHSFSDYPVKAVAFEHKAELVLPEDAKDEQEEIQSQYQKRPVDFAGRFVFIPLACGMGCEGGGIVDVLSGKAYPLPGGVSDPPGLPGFTFDRISYTIDSRLMVLTGNINEVDTHPGFLVRRYYIFEREKFRLIDTELLTFDTKTKRWISARSKR